MKRCKNCGHEIRKIKGQYLHRMEHPRYSGIGSSGGVTFRITCLNLESLSANSCLCKNPEPESKGSIMKTILLLILFTISVNGQQTNDNQLRYQNGRIEIYIDTTPAYPPDSLVFDIPIVKGWFSIDSLFVARGLKFKIGWTYFDFSPFYEYKIFFNLFMQEWLDQVLNKKKGDWEW